MGGDRKIKGAVDLISNLPDEILQYILCFVPTKVAISTSLLSRRWRHVWCELPSLSLHVNTLMKTAASVDETLTRYTAPKTKSFHLTITPFKENIPYIDRWIKCAMSHNVENLSLEFPGPYSLPDFFYNSGSFKQLNITLSCYSYLTIVPDVSWTSLKKLSLTFCGFCDESMAKILSGCPILENLSLSFLRPDPRYYCGDRLPDFPNSSSSVKQLSITLSSSHRNIPKCITVYWRSLKKLSLSCCGLCDESMAKILSSCPVLENLTLSNCDELKVIDLSKSLGLRTLEVNSGVRAAGPTQIVAPHIHFLRLLNVPQYLSYTLVDVASLTEAELEISFSDSRIKTDFPQLQVKVLEMLDKLQNAEKLTLGRNFVQIVSLVEIRGVPFPMLKVKSLTLDINICQYVIPGIKRLLQNSPELEKLTVHGRNHFHVPVQILYIYLELQGLNMNKRCRTKTRATWAKKHCKDAKLEHVVSLVELMLKSCTEKLNKMVVLLDELYLTFKIEDLTAALSHHNNVTIVLSNIPYEPV